MLTATGSFGLRTVRLFQTLDFFYSGGFDIAF